MSKYWVLVEVWNHGHEKIIHAYGVMSRQDSHVLNERYKESSEYDFFNMCEYDSEQNYKSALRYRKGRGQKIEYRKM